MFAAVVWLISLDACSSGLTEAADVAVIAEALLVDAAASVVVVGAVVPAALVVAAEPLNPVVDAVPDSIEFIVVSQEMNKIPDDRSTDVATQNGRA